MATTIRPLHDRVLIQRIDEQKQCEAESLFLILRKKNRNKVR